MDRNLSDRVSLIVALRDPLSDSGTEIFEIKFFGMRLLDAVAVFNGVPWKKEEAWEIPSECRLKLLVPCPLCPLSCRWPRVRTSSYRYIGTVNRRIDQARRRTVGFLYELPLPITQPISACTLYFHPQTPEIKSSWNLIVLDRSLRFRRGLSTFKDLHFLTHMHRVILTEKNNETSVMRFNSRGVLN